MGHFLWRTLTLRDKPQVQELRVMKSTSISEKTELLREEIKRILLEERLYRQATQRSTGSGHAARELRLMKIREELEELRSGGDKD
jgi:hypothetical protein